MVFLTSRSRRPQTRRLTIAYYEHDKVANLRRGVTRPRTHTLDITVSSLRNSNFYMQAVAFLKIEVQAGPVTPRTYKERENSPLSIPIPNPISSHTWGLAADRLITYLCRVAYVRSSVFRRRSHYLHDCKEFVPRSTIPLSGDARDTVWKQ